LLPILTVHDELVIESDANVAQGTPHWLSTSLPGAVEAVRGHPELTRQRRRRDLHG
jgi:hypothetical protein